MNYITALIFVILGILVGNNLKLKTQYQFNKSDAFVWLGFLLSGFFALFSYLFTVSGMYPNLVFLTSPATTPLTYSTIFFLFATIIFTHRSHLHGYRVRPW